MKTLVRSLLAVCLLLLALPATAQLRYACVRDGEASAPVWQAVPPEGFFRLFEADFRRNMHCWIDASAPAWVEPQALVLEGVPQLLVGTEPVEGAAPAPLLLRAPRTAVVALPRGGMARVRLDTALPIGGALHVDIVPLTEALADATRESEVRSALLTILFALGLVSAMFAYALRDATIGWYTGLTLGIGVVWSLSNGYAVTPFALIQHYPLLVQYALLLSYGITLFCGTQFGRGLSSLPERAPRLDRFLLGAAVAVMAYTLAGLVPAWYAPVMEYYNLVGLIMLVLLMVPGCVAFATGGYRVGAFYLVGWLPIIVSWIGILLLWMHLMPGYPDWVRAPALLLHRWGLVPEWLGSPHVREVALLVQAVIFSLALADRAARLRYARERATMIDKVCGLPNRGSFQALGAERMAAQRDRMRPLALLLIDIDRFAAINETLGYDSGDMVLRELARRLRQQWPEPALIARVGGNQFALLLDTSMSDATLRQALLPLVRNPVVIEDQRLDVSLSCGAACFPEHGREIDTLLRHAEMALAAARHETHGVLVYHPELETDRRFQLSLLSSLRTAMAKQELQLFLQPKVSRRSGHVTGAEALLRWRHPQLGLVAPAEFLPFAEQTGLIVELTRWTLEQALLLARGWQQQRLDLRLSVNLSAHDLADPDLPAHIGEFLMHSRANPRLICLEITESEVMRNPQLAIATMHALHKLGFQLALDDFGTGNSSLAYLQEMPVEEIKIDRSFVGNARQGERGRRLLQSVVAMCQSLGLRTVAEGVEREVEWQMMGEIGCDEVQGYYVSAPLPPEAFDEWLSLNQPFVTSSALARS